MKAVCQCGRLSVGVPGPTPAVVACHCIDCQRRTGAPFGVVAYYAADQLSIEGEAKRYVRATAAGGVFESYFCPECGSTVYVKAGKHPALIGVPVGALAEPGFPPPVRSVWEQSRHPWVMLPDEIEHFPQGRA
jgi:hypothetical protein